MTKQDGRRLASMLAFGTMIEGLTGGYNKRARNVTLALALQLRDIATCPECRTVWKPINSRLPINYCSKCGAKIQREEDGGE